MAMGVGLINSLDSTAAGGAGNVDDWGSGCTGTGGKGCCIVTGRAPMMLYL